MTIDRMILCTAALTASLLAACGGGGSAAPTDPTASAAPVASASTSTSSGTASGSTSATTGTAGTTRSATSDSSGLIEALATQSDIASMLAASQISAPVATSASTTSTASNSTAQAAADAAADTVVSSAIASLDYLLGASASAISITASTTASSTAYIKISDENRGFAVVGSATVRFGDPATNRWTTKVVNGYGECTNTFFGTDPAAGTVKQCQAPAGNAPLAASTVAIMSTPVGNMPAIDLTKIPQPFVGSMLLQIQDTAEVPPVSDGGDFRTSCTVSRITFDDPIVYPGQVGKSHLHTFFGNTGVSANSTPESLRTTGASTCRGGIINRSAYWVPTIIDTRNGTPVLADGNQVYYKNGVITPAQINPIPVGLRMIAGDPTLTSAGPTYITRFKCIGGPNNENDKYGSTIANCDVGAWLWQEIFFPQCWDGVNLDSPDHKSHMSYPLPAGNSYACPSSHPVAIPQITFNVTYPITEKDQPLHWHLSSDNYASSQPGGYSSHGDWFNGWMDNVSQSWAKNCIQPSRDCHSHLLGDGRMIY